LPDSWTRRGRCRSAASLRRRLLLLPFALAFGLAFGFTAIVSLMQMFMGELMNDDSTFGSGGETLANDNPATGRVAFDAMLSDFLVVEDDI
jgi:hypothetical protein